MSSELTLFDLPSKGTPACWSLNPWKTRAALNYKQIPYKTEWVEYPDVAPKLKAAGIPANDNDVNPSASYSIPAVKLPDGRYIMDSRAIADALEELKSEPSLHLDSPYLKRTQDAVGALMPNLAPNVFPLVPNLLNPPSYEYFHRTRAERFGMSLAELSKSDKAGENAWKNAEPAIQGLRSLLSEKDGPFVEGKQVTYADFVLGGLWIFLKKLDEAALFDRLLASDKSFVDHWDAVKPWFERQD